MTDARSAGVLLGLACGDALGRPVEFQSPAEIERRHGTVRTMLANGTHGQPAGTVTDDTDLALCIARSLVDRGRFDPADIASRYVAWYEGGPFDVGLMTADAVRALRGGVPWDEAGEQVWRNRPEESNAGNGSVMCCAPLAVAFQDDRDALARVSRDASRITHADPRCTAGCAVLNLTIAALLDGVAAREALGDALDAVDDADAVDADAVDADAVDADAVDADAVDDVPAELVDALRPLADGVEPAALENTGYVVHTLQTSLHDALTAGTAEEAVVRSVNRGGDTDTLGAVTGAVAGARFGRAALPAAWLDELSTAPEIDDLSKALSTGSFEAA